MSKRRVEEMESDEAPAIASPGDFVLIENRKRCSIRLPDGPRIAGNHFELIPGLNIVPARVWNQAKESFDDTDEDVRKSVIQLLVQDGDVREHDAGALTDLPTATAVEIASRPMGLH
jgi:hypothetical protein